VLKCDNWSSAIRADGARVGRAGEGDADNEGSEGVGTGKGNYLSKRLHPGLFLSRQFRGDQFMPVTACLSLADLKRLPIE